jgi:hypothetical protein
VVLVGVVGVLEVDAERDCDVGVGGRRRDDHLLRARVEMLLRVLALGEEAGRLDHDVGAEVAPRQRGRVPLGRHLDRLAVDDDRVVGVLDGPGVGAVDGVVLQEVGERLGVDEVVDPHPLDVRVALVRRTEDVAPDAAEAVDPHAYGHA